MRGISITFRVRDASNVTSARAIAGHTMVSAVYATCARGEAAKLCSRPMAAHRAFAAEMAKGGAAQGAS